MRGDPQFVLLKRSVWVVDPRAALRFSIFRFPARRGACGGFVQGRESVMKLSTRGIVPISQHLLDLAGQGGLHLLDKVRAAWGQIDTAPAMPILLLSSLG